MLAFFATAEFAVGEFAPSLACGPATFAISGKAVAGAAELTVGPYSAALSVENLAESFDSADRGAFAVAGQAIAGILQIAASFGSFTLLGEDAEIAAAVNVAAFALNAQPVVGLLSMPAQKADFALSAEATLFDLAFAVATGRFTVLGWSIKDVTGPTGDHNFLIEVQAHDGTQIQTFYLSTDGFLSSPTDAPTNTYYAPRVIDPGNFERHLFSQGTTRGKSSVGYGDIVVASGDPGNGNLIDDWLTYGWDGRPIKILAQPAHERTMAGASILFNGRLDRLTSVKPLDSFALKIADRLSDLEQPLLTTRFAGTTTSSGATAEGNADLEGQIKQRIFGTCKNVLLQPANPYDLIYLASDSALQSVDAVYDGGAALTSDGDDADIATLQAATISAGHYRTCTTSGLIRLGGVPTFAVTADLTEGADAAARTAAQLAKRMLIAAGMTSSDYVSGSFDQLDVKNDAECGYLVDDDRTTLTAIQDVLDSIGGWMFPNADGSFVVGRFEAPSATPALSFDLDTSAITDSLDRVDAPIPSWRINLQYAPIFHVQGDSELAGSVSAERRAFLATEFRATTADDSSVKTKHLLAPEMTLKTYLVDAADAAAEATRLLALYSAEREMYDLTLPLRDAWGANPGDSITLTHPRLGLADGKPFAVLGRIDQYAQENVKFELWG
jgi:hypothetical protein